jgi:hypothetical protein
LATLCLILCLASAAERVRSYRTADGVAFLTRRGANELYACGGFVFFQRQPTASNTGCVLAIYELVHQPFDPFMTAFRRDHGILGVYFGQMFTSNMYDAWWFAVPIGYVAFAFGALTCVLSLVGRFRWWSRNR